MNKTLLIIKKKLYPNEFDIINTGLEGMLEKKIKAILSIFVYIF